LDTIPRKDARRQACRAVRNTNRNRKVALKVLPEHLAEDRGRRVRFEREARMLASLNHPNVAAIYGVDTLGSTPCLVLEYVDGRTLDERIAGGPIPVDEALALAKQIVLAVAAAHERGIIYSTSDADRSADTIRASNQTG
jgi:serine/threonine-protein kinase